MKIFIVGRVRGFFKHIINEKIGSVQFIGESGTYEVSSKIKSLIANLLRTKIVGFFGIFKIAKAIDLPQCEAYLSFNRFLNSDRPYYIYLENPTALCNYSLTCLKSPFVRKKLENSINNPKLKKIICMSDACAGTINKVLPIRVPMEKVTRIYPYVPANLNVTKKIIEDRCSEKKLKLLYIAQGARFYSKGGLEIIAAYEQLCKSNNIELTIITNINQIDGKLVDKIIELGINLKEFKYAYEELEKIYASHHVLIQPSSDDSFGLTILEGMKAGLAIIASNLYAFKELVHDGENGYLIDSSYQFFDSDNIPNPKVWNNRKKTIYSQRLDNQLKEKLVEKIKVIDKNRDMLKKYSVNSYEKANMEYGKTTIQKQWEKVLIEKGE